MDSSSGDDAALNKLLKEWKLESISSHLQAEKIDVEVLEMIKLQHIRMLLCNYPLGIQIRFEHNLEQWRLKIGKPIYSCTHRCCCQGNELVCKNSYNNPSKPLNETSRCIPNGSQQQPQQHHIRIARKIVELPIAVNNPLISTPPETPMTNRSLASSAGSPAQSTRSHTSSSIGGGVLESNTSHEDVTFPLKPINPLENVSLRDILMGALPEGPMLIDLYAKRKTFNPRERKRLLNIIVSYFMLNNIRFDLQTSYALEVEIIKMFPNEKLEMYRRGRRGSLYCKYMNYKQSLLSSRKRKLPREDVNETSSDMECMSVNDQSSNERDDDEPSVDVVNAAMDEFIAEEAESSGKKMNDGEVATDATSKDNFILLKPKIEVDTEYVYN